MKHGGIIHPDLAKLLAGLGHGDPICVADAGLPIPAGVSRIDLDYRHGQPGFLDVVSSVAAELIVEARSVAGETVTVNAAVFEALKRVFDSAPELVSHEALKAKSTMARAIIRTGENTQYAEVYTAVECSSDEEDTDLVTQP